MKYVLFLCGRIGFEALTRLLELGCAITHVFIESEHAHEHAKYAPRLAERCENENISCSLDAGAEEIGQLLAGKAATGFDYILCFGYRRMIPDEIRELPRIAALGTHFSPLPRYRGFAPLNWLLINGEGETAVNMFYLTGEVDSGDIVEREAVPIYDSDDINDLFERCVRAFRRVLANAAPKLERGVFNVVGQDNEKATFTCARNPEDGKIDWNWPAKRIYNLVRAITYPFPGAFTYMNGERLTVWSCNVYPIPKYEGIVHGKVIRILRGQGVVVLCGDGAVLLRNVQQTGSEIRTADRIIKSIRLTLSG